MAMPVIVLMIDSPSAPPSAQARASATMSEVLGVSLIQSGFLITARQARTRSREHARVGAELDAARLDVRAGDVHLQRVDAVEAVEPGAAGDVLVEGLAEEVHQHARPALAQERQLVALEALDADVLEADRVEHPRRGLADARRRRCRSGARARCPW